MPIIACIAEKTRNLDNSRVNVINTVQGLTEIAESNAGSSEKTSGSVAEVVSLINSVAANAAILGELADSLRDNTREFKIQQ